MTASHSQALVPAVWSARSNSADEKMTRILPEDGQAQREFYFGKEHLDKARFVIHPDPNGHNVFDDLELFVTNGHQGKIASRWSKDQVVSTLASIYRRIESFLETTQNKRYADPWEVWYITFEKKTKSGFESSSEWWSLIPSTVDDVRRGQLEAKNRQRFACAGWSSQLRIVVRCQDKEVWKSIAESRKRDLLRSMSANRLPVLPNERNETKAVLRVRTDAQDRTQYVDQWVQTAEVLYDIRRPSPLSVKFVWRWGIHDVDDAFSVRPRNAIADFDRRFKPKPESSSRRRRSGSGSRISFSEPYGIEVVFEEEKPPGQGRGRGPIHIRTGRIPGI